MNKDIRICLRPGCGRVARSRGVCSSCYNIAASLVRSGQTTFEKLEESGKVLGTSTRAYLKGTKRWFLAAV